MSSARLRVRRIFGRTLLTAVVAYVIWDRVEAYRLSRTIAAIAARGEPVRYADALPAPRTDEQRQASNLYAQAASFAREQAAEDNNRAGRLDLDNPTGNEVSLSDVVATYRDDSAALQVLDQATRLDFGGFRDEDAMPSGSDPLIALGALACLRADIAAVRGAGEAADALVPCIRLERTLTSSWSRSAHAVRVLGSLRILFRHAQPSDASLATLQRALVAWPDEDRGLQTILTDRARFIEIAEGGMRGFVPPVVRILLHPLMIRSARLGIASFEPALAMARLPWTARWDAVAENRRLASRALPARQGPIAALLDPFPMAFAGLGLSQAGQELAARRVAIAAVATERFRRAHGGTPPASLGGLVPTFLASVPEDPLSMKPLAYRPDPDGYVIYSVDSNRKDDGGELYGHGAAVARHVGPQSPRDLGIRVPLNVARH